MSSGTYSWGANEVSDYENGNSNSWLPTPMLTNSGAYFAAMVLAPNALVATYAKSDPQIQENTVWYLGAINRSTGASLWEIALPDVGTGLKGVPLHQGLAIDRNGNIIVTQRNGNVLCYGTGTVSVAAGGSTMPAVVPAPVAASAATWTSAPQAPQAQARTTGASCQVPQTAVASATGANATLSQIVLAAGPAPSAAAVYEPWRDKTDIVASAEGAPVHSLNPVERVQKASYRPRDMTWTPGRECLPVVAVKATSSARGCRPDATTDRSLATRWTAAGPGMQSITYDLGAVRDVDAVSVAWYGSKACLTTFAIEVSADGKAFTQVDAGSLSGRRTHTMLRSFVPVDARYVRLTMDAGKGMAQSVYEVGVHGVQGEQRAEAR